MKILAEGYITFYGIIMWTTWSCWYYCVEKCAHQCVSMCVYTHSYLQTNKQKRGSCNPQYVLISFADIKSLQIYLQQRAYRKIKNRS